MEPLRKQKMTFVVAATTAIAVVSWACAKQLAFFIVNIWGHLLGTATIRRTAIFIKRHFLIGLSEKAGLWHHNLHLHKASLNGSHVKRIIPRVHYAEGQPLSRGSRKRLYLLMLEFIISFTRLVGRCSLYS